MKNKKLLLSVLVIFNAATFIHATPVEEGKSIFTSRCAACHNVNKVMTGPALAGVDGRHSIDWIIKFVHSSQALVKGGDKDAVALFQKFNKIPMPDHTDLSGDQIKSIVEYIKSEAKPVGEEKAPFAKPGELKTYYKPLSLQKDYGFFIAYLVAVAMLISALLLAVYLKSFQRKMQEEKNSA